MLPQDVGGLSSGGFNTTALNQQFNSLLGNPQIKSSSGMPSFDPGMLNMTAPQSSATNPNVANMVAALKGDAQ